MLRKITAITLCLWLTTAASTPVNDPFESINRKTHNFNRAFDATVLKPLAKLYKVIIPPPIQTATNNFFNNLQLLPTVANDVLQGEGNHAIKDSWRFIINSTIGVGGVLDVASEFGLPLHHNDLGITLAKWGDTDPPYIVLPFLGPSTIRDGFGLMFDYSLFTVYPYIDDDAWLYGLVGYRYIQLRAQLLDTDPLIKESLDPYLFIRDAYIQHRNYLISGGEDDGEALYIDEFADNHIAPGLSKTVGADVAPPLKHVAHFKVRVPMRA